MHKTILHFSDIHFGGRQAPNAAEEMLAAIERLRPDAVAVSGDLTQRARTAQFREARAFLDRVKAPTVVVPGNHDVPLWNVFRRFFSPLVKYRKWITPDLFPVYADEELAIMGLNTTRSLTVKGGGISEKDLHLMRRRMLGLPPGACKVLVAHHPIAPPPGQEREKGIVGLKRAMRAFEECGIEVILTGHAHQSHAESTKDLYPGRGRHILLVQAGTAASLRGRGHERLKNSFNWLDITDHEIRVTRYVYSEDSRRFNPSTFHVTRRERA